MDSTTQDTTDDLSPFGYPHQEAERDEPVPSYCGVTQSEGSEYAFLSKRCFETGSCSASLRLAGERRAQLFPGGVAPVRLHASEDDQFEKSGPSQQG